MKENQIVKIFLFITLLLSFSGNLFAHETPLYGKDLPEDLREKMYLVNKLYNQPWLHCGFEGKFTMHAFKKSLGYNFYVDFKEDEALANNFSTYLAEKNGIKGSGAQKFVMKHYPNHGFGVILTDADLNELVKQISLWNRQQEYSYSIILSDDMPIDYPKNQEPGVASSSSTKDQCFIQ